MPRHNPSTLGPVLRVDSDVLGRQIARPHPRLAGAAGAQVDFDARCPCPADTRRLRGARSSCGTPSLNSSTEPTRTLARSRTSVRVARPATATSRPQFGSPPCTAVFTSGELAIARAVVFASSSVCAPVTRIVMSLVAPSPPRTIAMASGSQTGFSAATSVGKSSSPQRDAARAVREHEHAVVGGALAVDADRVERVVHGRLQRPLQQRRLDTARRS